MVDTTFRTVLPALKAVDLGDGTYSVGVSIQGTVEAPTGRTATYVIAASDAPAHVKAQADYVCTGTSDDVLINAAIAALPVSGGEISLSQGLFSITSTILINKNGVYLHGVSNGHPSAGGEDGTYTTRINSAVAIDLVTIDTDSVGGRLGGIRIESLTLYGSGTANGKAGIRCTGKTWGGADTFPDDQAFIFGNFISNCQWGMYGYGDATHIFHNSVLFCGNGIKWTGPYVKVDQCEVSDCTSLGIVQVARVTGCTLARNGGYSISHSDPTVECIVADCQITNSVGYAIYFVQNVSNCIITSSTGVSIKYCHMVIGCTIKSGGDTAIEGCQIISNNYINACVQGIKPASNSVVSGNKIISSSSWHGISCYAFVNVTITGNYIATCSHEGIILEHNCTGNTITGNVLSDNYSGGSQIKLTDNCDNNIINANKLIKSAVTPTNGIYLNTGCDNNTVIGNDVTTSATNVLVDLGTNNQVRSNTGYIAPSEIRTASGSLTGGAANAILFAWHNPEAQDIFIKKVIVNITTADADAANIDVGIADDATYTNGGTEFFNDLTGETILVYDSWIAGDLGTQLKWLLLQDSASATDGWVVAKILDNDGTSIVGSYYLEYTGK